MGQFVFKEFALLRELHAVWRSRLRMQAETRIGAAAFTGEIQRHGYPQCIGQYQGSGRRAS